MGGLIALLITTLVRVRLQKKEEERLKRIEKEVSQARKEVEEVKRKVDLANKNIENIEMRHSGILIYIDGLPFAAPPVLDPFFEGTKLMAEYKWDEAIEEFKKAMKEAKGGHFVGLYNLIGICYYTSGRLSEALESYEQSLRFARQFKDKIGEAVALGNIGLIYQRKGDLDKALKYCEEALKIDREIGNKKGEAQDLRNIGLIYAQKGEMEKALAYLNQALKIFKQIGAKSETEIVEGYIKSLTAHY